MAFSAEGGALVEEDGAVVVRRLEALSSDLRAPVLVVGFGSPMKACVKAATRAGVSPLWVTGTDDKARAFSCSGAAQVASVGAKFDARLFANPHIVVEAAKRCGAKALLVCDPAFACNDLLLMVAEQEGMLVLRPLSKDRSLALWAECEREARAPSYEVAWRTCPKCKMPHDERPVLEHAGVCPTCGELYRLTSDERIALTFDEASFEEWDAQVPETDPLAFPGYDGVLEKQRKRSGLEEAVRCGSAAIEGMRTAVCVMESTFMMGSMGSVVGEKITRAVERATAEGLPLVIFTASGGARMQEGLVSLMQMGKISAAIERHGRAGLLYVSVITDPTTGGVTASFAMQGDVILSEPHALIGFAGRRVIQDTIKQTLPEGFQTAEFALEHGLIDAIVEREDLRSVLARLIALHDSASAPCVSATGMPSKVLEGIERPSMSASGVPGMLGGLAQAARAAASRSARVAGVVGERVQGSGAASLKRALKKRGVADAPSVKPLTGKAPASENRAWESVLLARNTHRPTAQRYIDAMVDGFFELHGDRMFADDGAIVGGVGWIDGRAVTVVAQEKGINLNQRIARNFGCPQPEGYRKSLRLMRQAEKFGRPIVCLIDTQGAFCGKEAEERGVGNAIADNLVAMAGIGVPVVCVVLGEGGSGGALALAMGNRVAMQEHAVYSVLSPEGFASILWKDRSRAPEAAAVMKMSAAEAHELGLIEEVLSEGAHAAHENPEQAAEAVRAFIARSLDELEGLDADELREQRYERFRAF